MGKVGKLSPTINIHCPTAAQTLGVAVHLSLQMRILMISDVYFPRINGVSTSIQTFQRCLREQGHVVTLVAPDYGEPAEDEHGIVRVGARKVWTDPEDRMMRWGAFKTAIAALDAADFDIVHIQTPFLAHLWGVPVARRWGLPVVESYHTFFEEYFYHYIRFLPRAWLKFAARYFSRRECQEVDGLVVPSQPMLAVLRGYGVNTGARVIPTGLDMSRFSQGDGLAFRQRFGLTAEQPLLIHVGRVAHEKNIPFLLEVMAQVVEHCPDAILLIAGEGPAVDSLQQQARQLSLEHAVRFIGYLERERELPSCYRAGDVFVFASRTETQGLVLLEAMACGTPVVTTAVMGTREIMQAEQGGIVVEEKVADFAAAVLRLLADHALHQRLSQEARQYAQSWSDTALTQRLLAYYDGLISAAHS